MNTENEILHLLEQLRGRVPSDKLAGFKDLVKTHGEYSVALEHLCALLEAQRTAIHRNEFDTIMNLLEKMPLSKRSFDYYRTHLHVVESD